MMGVIYRDMRLADNTDSLSNVLVLEKYSPTDFLLRTESGLPFHATICPTHIPYDFVRGATITLMTYEQIGSCKSFAAPSLGYTMKQKDGKLVLANLEAINAR